MKRNNSNIADRMEIRRQASRDLGTVFDFGVVGVLILALLLAFAMGTVYAGQGAGNALDFDGKNDYVEAGGYDIDIFSISAWVKLPTVDNWAVIVDFTPEGSTNRRGLLLSGPAGPDTGSPTIVYGANNYKISLSGDIDHDEWHHIAGTFDGLEPKLYVDGVSVDLGQENSTVGNVSESKLTIGTWTDTTPETLCFPGIIDEVRVWDTALEQVDIQDLMHKRVPDDHPNRGNLIGYWRFDEPPSDSPLCADDSGSVNDGTMIGMETFSDRITSTAPIATDTVANKTDMAVIWHKDKWNSSAELAVDARSAGINDPNYAIFAHNDGELTANTSNNPAGIDRRWNRVWTFDVCDVDGDMIADFTFFVPEGQITNKESIVLLESDSDTDFSGATQVSAAEISGDLTEVQFTNVSITDGMSYTIGSISDNALPVQLSVFTATNTMNGVLISWRTESELDNIGFNLYRSDIEGGKYTKINTKLIQGAGTDGNLNDYLFTDDNVVFGKTYFYYLENVDAAGVKNQSETIKTETIEIEKVVVMPHKVFKPMNKFRLMQNYPNPFNPETWFPYELPTDATVIIRIYDANGHLVHHLDLGKQKAGIYVYKEKAAYWDGTDQTGKSVSSGLYFYTLEAGDFQATKRMIIVK